MHRLLTRRRRERGAGEDGFVLIAVLWILAALAGLVGMYAAYTAVSARSATIYEEKLGAEAAIYGALEMTALQFVNGERREPPVAGNLVFPVGDYSASVRFVSEDARLDLNNAPKASLARLFQTVGAKEDEANYFADRIVGWRTGDNRLRRNAETDLYAGAGRARPRLGAFQSVDELFALQGASAALVRRALPYLTVFGSRTDADAAIADPVLSAAGLASARRPSGAAEDAGQAAGAQGAAQETGGRRGPRTIRLDVVVQRAGGPATTAEIVLLLTPDDAEPYYVLFWQSE